MAEDSIKISPGTRFRIAIALAIAADILQLAVMPLFVEGAASPADDLLDVGMAAILTFLLGKHFIERLIDKRQCRPDAHR